MRDLGATLRRMFMASLREIRKRDRRERIYETAIRLFRERGYQDVSVAEITEASGVAKGTFFNYYPTKDHVLAEHHGRMTDAIMDRVLSQEFETCEQAILAYVHEFADWGEEDPRLIGIIVRRIFADAIMFESDQRMVSRQLPWFQKQIELGIQRGEIKPDVDRGAFVGMIAAVLSSVGNAWALSGGFDGRAEAVRRMRFVFDAARANPREQ